VAAPPYPFTLRQVQYLLAVADTLSFRRAAEECRVSQPSLSAQISEIEDGLGVRVFERDQRRVLLTAAGRDVVDRARALLAASDELVVAAQRAGDPLAGTLRIGVIPTISPYLLPSVTPELRARFPRLTVAWLEEKTDVLLAHLNAGTLEAALVALEADIGDVEHEVLARDPFFLVAAKDHPLGRGRGAAEPADLRDAEVLLLDEGHCFRSQALEVCGSVRARESLFRATSLSTLVQMVASGAGLTLLPSLAMATEARRARLAVRPFAVPAPGRTIALVWRKRSPLAPALREVADAIRGAYPMPAAVVPAPEHESGRIGTATGGQCEMASVCVVARPRPRLPRRSPRAARKTS
jgi:LysR family transcriptional regulator, hydrogen peroxide-inducible genes activator